MIHGLDIHIRNSSTLKTYGFPYFLTHFLPISRPPPAFLSLSLSLLSIFLYLLLTRKLSSLFNLSFSYLPLRLKKLEKFKRPIFMYMPCQIVHICRIFKLYIHSLYIHIMNYEIAVSQAKKTRIYEYLIFLIPHKYKCITFSLQVSPVL